MTKDEDRRVRRMEADMELLNAHVANLERGVEALCEDITTLKRMVTTFATRCTELSERLALR